MEHFPLSRQILDILKTSPRGLTITQISDAMGTNRNSIAKYLEMLRVSGQVEDRDVGAAKMYYISNRVPLLTILSFSDDGVIIIDFQQVILRANKQMERILQRPVSAIVRKQLSVLDLPEHIVHVELVAKALDGLESRDDIVIEQESGDTFYKVKYIPTQFEDGTKGATIVFEDVTSERLAEQELLESETKYRTFIDMSPEAVIITTTNFIIQIVNNQALAILGAETREVIIGRNVFDFIAPEEHKVAYGMAEAISKEGVVRNQELTLVQLSGNRIKAAFNAAVLKDNKGNPEFFVGSVRDITKRRQLEEERDKAHARLADFFENSPVGYYVLSPDKQFIMVNRRACKLLGYSRDELLGKKFDDIVAPEQQARIDKTHWPSIFTEMIVAGAHFILVCKDSSRINADVWMKEMLDNKGNAVDVRGVFCLSSDTNLAERCKHCILDPNL
jgi:PAS domain S-box-containing protein